MQVWDPDRYAAHARFVSDLGAPVIELLEPQPGERVLDLGCGDGALTEKLVDAGCRVVAVDSSPEQVRAARGRGPAARVADAPALGFDGEVDPDLMKAVLHWIRDPDAALAAIHRALAPGGRLVAEFGGHGCVASIRAAFGEVLAGRDIDAEILNPWYFPTAEEYRARLDANGFDVDSIRLFPRPTPLPSDLTDWLETFAQPYLAAVPKRDRRAILNQMRERLEPVLRTPDGDWFADYVRLRFAAARRD
ncbi:MAG: methyltransferase domain-containing protein [Acidobacteria bacterium]|nr:methyltransferase domain-containing protein [Acidobacteriota bacterium]